MDGFESGLTIIGNAILISNLHKNIGNQLLADRLSVCNEIVKIIKNNKDGDVKSVNILKDNEGNSKVKSKIYKIKYREWRKYK